MENRLTMVAICVVGEYYSCLRNKMLCCWRHCTVIVTPWRLRWGTAEWGWTYRLSPISRPAAVLHISPAQLCGKGVTLILRGNKVKCRCFTYTGALNWFTVEAWGQMKDSISRGLHLLVKLVLKGQYSCGILEIYKLESLKWLEVYTYKKCYCCDIVEIEMHQLEPYSVLAEPFQCSVPFWVENTLNWYWFCWWASKPVVFCLRERIWPSWGLR